MITNHSILIRLDDEPIDFYLTDCQNLFKMLKLNLQITDYLEHIVYTFFI